MVIFSSVVSRFPLLRIPAFERLGFGGRKHGENREYSNLSVARAHVELIYAIICFRLGQKETHHGISFCVGYCSAAARLAGIPLAEHPCRRPSWTVYWGASPFLMRFEATLPKWDPPDFYQIFHRRNPRTPSPMLGGGCSSP